MRIAAVSVLAILTRPAPCDHGVRGASLAVDLDRMEAACRDVARRLSVKLGPAQLGAPLDAPFESGLPACRFGGTRRVGVDPLPRELVGKVLHFGPRRSGDVWCFTRSERLRDAAGGVPASPELAARLAVRCAPARVTVL